MSDEPYRQERKPIKPEVQQNPTTPEEIQQLHKSFQADSELEVKNLGNAPPEFLEKIKGKQNFNPQNPQQSRGSSKLEELLEGLKERTHVYEKIQLPSLGKFYDGENGPTDGVIHIRPMTGEEEQILATSRFIKKGIAVNMIFNRCMQESYSSEKFLSADRTFLLIWLRGISYGREYDVEVTCPFTDKKFSYSIDLDLDVDLCPSDFGLQSLEGALPTTEYKFKYRLATGADEQKIQEHREKRSKFDTSNQSDDTLIYRTASLIKEVAGLTDSNEIQILLKKLPISDVSYLRNVTSEPPFGVNTKVTITSPYTMEDFEIDLPLEANFFFPRQRRTLTQV